MSREEVASQIGVSVDAMADYEAGRRRMSAVILMQLARIFRVSPSTFFEGVRAMMRAN